MFGLVNLQHLGGQVGSVAGAKFLHRVHAGGFQQFRILASHALDPEQIGMIRPFEDEGFGNPGFFGQFSAGFLGQAVFQQLFDGIDANLNQLGGIDIANAFQLIADALGHANSQTLHVYLSTEPEQLRSCCFPFTGFELNSEEVMI